MPSARYRFDLNRFDLNRLGLSFQSRLSGSGRGAGLLLLLLGSLWAGGALPGWVQGEPVAAQPLPRAAIYLDSLSNVAHPSLTVDARGGVHLALEPVSPAAEGGLPVQYAYCAAGCLADANWQVIRIGEAGLPGSEVRIRLNDAGQPRLLWFYQADWRESGTYRYASCDAHCTQPANWQSVAVARDLVGPGEGRYFALDRQGNPHFFYTSTETGHSGTFYRYCLGSCLSAASWHELQVSDNYLLGAFSLAFDAQNRLHVALSAEEDGRSALLYLTCAAACETVDPWQVTALGPLGVGLDFSLQLDGAGRPRLAVFSGALDDEVGSAAAANRLFYLWCDTQCAQAANWRGVDMGLAAGEGGNVDFALDGQSRPHFAVATSVYDPQQIDYVYCSSQCDSRPVWQRLTIENGEGGAASSCYWYVGKRPALALGTSGEILVAYGVEGRCVGQETTMQLVKLAGLQGRAAAAPSPLPAPAATGAATPTPPASP